jgi:glycosyltransferase involved in cell wall biosynthesis
MRAFASAGAAYNAGMRQAAGEVLVFAHQDVYLPPEWDSQLAAAVSSLFQSDPNWAVLGVWGITRESRRQGYMYCTGLQKVLGQSFSQPVPCNSLDEVVLVLRRSANLTFDEQLPGFHFYGTDICLQAQQRGFNSYIIPAFCIHNTEGMKFLPWAFWQSYLYMRRKWRNHLPLKTPCIHISRSAFPIVQHPLQSFYSHYIKREHPGQRVADPAALYHDFLRQRALSTTAAASSLSSPGGEGTGEEANNLCLNHSRSAPN